MSRIKNIRKSVDIKHMYIGLDLNKATINATVMDENGTVLNEVKIKSEPDSLRNLFRLNTTWIVHSNRELFNMVLGI